MSTLDIDPGILIQHDAKGLIRFLRWDKNNVMVFKPLKGGKEISIPEHDFVETHGRRRLRLIEQDGEGNPIQLREFGPGEDWTEEDDPEQAKLTEEGRRALALQFYVQKADEAGSVSLGDKGLQEFINLWRPVAIQKGFEEKEPDPTQTNGGKSPRKTFRVQVARLRHCIKRCGRPGERPLAAFRSNKGKHTKRKLPPQVDQAIDSAVAHYYEKRSHRYQDAYSHLDGLIKALNGKRTANRHFALPAREILRRRIDRAMTFDNMVRKYSRKEAWQKIHGHREHISAKKPLELVIIDSTPLDVYCLDTETLLPLGRPHLTVCIDVYSRMVLGYCITFEPPSLYSVLLCLKRVNKNKRYVSRIYPQITRPWDGWGLPTEILLDLDWSHKAPSFRHSMRNLGTEVHYAPSKTPQYKAICERLFLTIKTKLIEKLPGSSQYNIYVMRQIGLDPSKEALVTLADLDEGMHEFIDVYNYEKHKGIDAVPARVWHDGLVIQRRRWIKDVSALDHVLGRVEKASISGAGITFKNMQWHDESTTTMLLNDLVRYETKRTQPKVPYGQSRANVVIKWNPADASSISVWNRGGEPHPYWVSLPNADPQFLPGLSFWHHERLREFAEERNLKFSTVEQRLDAYNRLRNYCRTLAGEMPMRQSRQARRTLAWSQGQFDDTPINDPVEITLDDIIDVEAEASTAGLNKVEAEGVPDQLAAELLDRANEPPKGRTPSKITTAKAQRTKKRKNAEAEQAEHEAYVKKVRGDPTGDPKSRGTPVPIDDDDDEGWGVAPADPPARDEQIDSNSADDEGW
ncbi:DDE-type integrase/transposase/recombinase [Bradyrhizobium manausense]|uniref:DDE-type integrase/transposase/recombinase n=1 Tax=Bradyrhizobium manausense TaxID=989370 RepID=UPI001BA88B5F|nr:DDE-type integrase/transposase/recombinase [Bradyrhizobium manausense]MBR0793056.1 DDE-type integrase/transposase/recombinase [Bradyrhizobium manausense]